MVLLLLINGGYILMFSVINDGVEGLVLAFDATEKISIIDFNGIWGQALKNTVNLILLSVISDRIYKIFGIPDIMESIRSIFGFWESGIRILSWKVKTLYRNL